VYVKRAVDTKGKAGMEKQALVLNRMRFELVMLSTKKVMGPSVGPVIPGGSVS
jgi:hypothetical protein